LKAADLERVALLMPKVEAASVGGRYGEELQRLAGIVAR
jgi:hypothetical protein